MKTLRTSLLRWALASPRGSLRERTLLWLYARLLNGKYPKLGPVIENNRVYLVTLNGKHDIGFPIQDVLDNMGDFQLKEFGGVVYVWSDDEVYSWIPADGWMKHRKLDPLLPTQTVKDDK